MSANTPPFEAAPTGELSFEDSFRRLEEIVRRLEDDGLSLDEALKAYEEGAALADRCSNLLETAQLRLTRLSGAGTETPIE